LQETCLLWSPILKPADYVPSEGEQINTYDGLCSINHENRGHILISIFKKNEAKNPREAERRAKQEEKRQKAQTRGESAIK